YYLMRRRGHPANRVRAVVDFMIGYYDPAQLVEMAKGIYAEARLAADDRRRDCFAALEQVYMRAPEPKVRRDFIRQMDAELFSCDEAPEALKGLREDWRFDNPELWMPKPTAKGPRKKVVEKAWSTAISILSAQNADPGDLGAAIALLDKALSDE